MITGILPITKNIIHYGCIHNLEKDCDILNKDLGDCEIECENRIVWRCKFFRINVYERE